MYQTRLPSKKIFFSAKWNQRYRSSRPEVFCKKGVLRNFAKFSGKHLRQSLFFDKVAGLIKKEALAQVFSCEFCEISENNFSYRTLPVSASEDNRHIQNPAKHLRLIF